MFFHMVMFVWEFVLDLVAVMRMANDEKDLEIMLLRQQYHSHGRHLFQPEIPNG